MSGNGVEMGSEGTHPGLTDTPKGDYSNPGGVLCRHASTRHSARRLKKKPFGCWSTPAVLPLKIARELGIRRNQLYKWQEQMRAKGHDVFPGRGRQSRQAEEMRRLRRELERVREERDILKKAAAYFAKESG